MKRFFVLVLFSLLLVGCAFTPVEKPTAAPTAVVSVVAESTPIASVVIEPTPVITSDYGVEGFYFDISNVVWRGDVLEFTIGGVQKESAIYVVGVTINNTKGVFKSVRIDRGGSAHIVAEGIQSCGEPGTAYEREQVVISYNPFGGFQGKFDIGFISGVCG